MALKVDPPIPDSPRARPNVAGLKAIPLPQLPEMEESSDQEDSKPDSNEQQISDFLIAALILRQDDQGFWGSVERATEKLADVTERLGDSVQQGAEKVADKIEKSSIAPEPLRKEIAKTVRTAGASLNHTAHATARVERKALAVEHVVAQNVGGDYFAKLAMHESANKPNALPPIDKKTGKRASTAAGLYQFTNGTWLGVVYQHGKNHGGPLAEAAEHIHPGKDRKGNLIYECDPGWSEKILEMRTDRQLSTLMAQDFTNANAAALHKSIGNRPLNDGDLYMAHFMGPANAAKVLIGLDKNPNALAVDAFKDAAKANPNIFYKHVPKQGAPEDPRTFRELYDLQTAEFVQKPGSDVQLASASKNLKSAHTGSTHKPEFAGLPTAPTPFGHV